MSRSWVCACVLLAWCALCYAGPIKRAAASDLAAKRRSEARNFIRFGRSPYPAYVDEHARVARARHDNLLRFGRSDSFLRFGRSEPLRMLEQEMQPDDEYDRYEAGKRRSSNFVRLGRRDDEFMRLGRSTDRLSEDLYPGVEVNGELTLVRKEPKPKKDSFLRLGRGHDSFLRLGRPDRESFLRLGRPDKDALLRLGNSNESHDGLNEFLDDEEQRECTDCE